MRRIGVTLPGGKKAFIDLDALGGATIGVNLYYQGKLVNPADIMNSLARPQTVRAGDQTTDTVYEGSNLYFTVERAQDAAGSMFEESDDIALVYDDATNTVTASLLPTGVTAGTYGDPGHIPQITVGADGRITAITLIAVGTATDILLLLETGDFLTTEAGDHLGGTVIS